MMIESATIAKVLAAYPIKKGLDKTFEALNKALKKKKLHLSPDGADLSLAGLSKLSHEVAVWCHHMEYSHSGSSVELQRLYIDLDLYIEPISVSEEKQNKRIRLKSVFRKLEEHLILLGPPGCGKTTTVKAICRDIMRGTSALSGYLPVPIVIRLREVDNTRSVYDLLLTRLNITVLNKKDDVVRVSKLDYEVKQSITLRILNENRMLLIFDGFDEIDSRSIKFRGEEMDCKDKFAEEFKSLCLNTRESLIILTSRTADFHHYVTGARKYELSKLSGSQVRAYIKKFFRNENERLKAEIEIVNKKLLGAEYIPLTLSYLCIIYRKYGRLFNSRRETYNKLLDLLLEDWDINRQVRRSSRFVDFDVYDKKQFLRRLAFELSVRCGKSFFSQEEVKATFTAIIEDYQNLSAKELKLILREIETHTGLFIRAGEGYMFSHKAMQEYLFALYMYEFPEVPSDVDLLYRFPDELALTVSFSENPSLYLAYLVMNRFERQFYQREFLFPFIDRLMLESVTFKVHPYLAVSFLLMYSEIRSTSRTEGTDRNTDLDLSHFFAFLNSDQKVIKSFKLLASHYKISEEHPQKNIILLKRNKPIDPRTSYMEPEELVAAYDFYEYFA